MPPELLALLQAIIAGQAGQPAQQGLGQGFGQDFQQTGGSSPYATEMSPLIAALAQQQGQQAQGGVHPGQQLQDGPVGENAQLGWQAPLPPQMAALGHGFAPPPQPSGPMPHQSFAGRSRIPFALAQKGRF